ncbi:MAG: Loki-CTERM sorting domain-containing protein [Candidatus Thorarchaeota archaeon]
MNLKWKIFPIVFLTLALALFLSPATTYALPPATYTPGDEAAIFDGHTFTEDYWTVEKTFTDDSTNDSAEIIMSYVNYGGTGGFHAALLALGDIYDYSADVNSTLPYQLFAMHFTTPSGKEIFVGAVFAFLYAFNDTNLNNVVDGGENRWFCVPYGWNGGNRTADPVASAISVTNPSAGHYRFGVTYENLYCRLVIPIETNIFAFLATLLNPIMEVQISELTFTYDIEVDTETGEITAETFYDIGQISAVRIMNTTVTDFAIINAALENVTVGAAHFVTAFGSNYYVEEGTTTPTPAANWIATNITTDPAGNERAWAVGVRGTYDLINETDDTTVASGLPAISWVFTPAISDLLFLAWQLPASADFLSVFAYAVSPTLQMFYDGPLDVYNNADDLYQSTAFWYAISFPQFGGYRIEHDPVYTAYSNIGQQTQPGIPGFPFEAIIIGVVACLVAVFLLRRRKHT